MEDVRIYIAEQRGEMAIGKGRLRSTLNYGGYVSPHRMPIGCLHQVNEWLGRSGQTLTLPLPERSVSVFVPLAGEIALRTKTHDYTVPLGNLSVLSVEAEVEVWVEQSQAGAGYFAFQQFVFSGVGECAKDMLSYTLPIVNPLDRNKLLPVLGKGDAPFQIYIGAFAGKAEYKLVLDPMLTHVFALTLDGNFEVNERLLFAGDALSLSGSRALEAECLSTTGLLLVANF
ncbi:hypothetical protein GCM10011386_37680 [Parapedobacter defluvii]|uniref:Quercetin 2,3-dioxygenase C-terminal cupin domain-containing protein n=1 Tax=Parapedobacter defluvii TaxID=2045106 RepID=A0ABQ1MNE3_9SPHI|nr:hypothetical protein [Parapedobacter defluvii]GGC42001.1 hypothetical protein GCM10011386_37680 [Parapedobacter defluvii]